MRASRENPLRGFIEKPFKHWQKLNKTGIFIDKQTVLCLRMITKRIKIEVYLRRSSAWKQSAWTFEWMQQLVIVNWFQYFQMAFNNFSCNSPKLLTSSGVKLQRRRNNELLNVVLYDRVLDYLKATASSEIFIVSQTDKETNS